MIPHRWTDDDVERLRELYPRMPNREIARILGVSKLAIDHKTERLGLRWTEKTYRVKNIACDNCGKIMLRQLSTMTGNHCFCSAKCYNEWKSKHAYTVEVNLSASPDLAYVCGVLLGDGFCGRFSQGRRKEAFVSMIALEVVEKTFALSFMESLQRLGLRPRIYRNRKKGNRRDTYFVKAYSKKFHQWWTEQNLPDLEDMFFRDTELLKEFVRGFYESEGSYYKRAGPYDETLCQLSNTDLEITELFKKAISRLSFKTSVYCHKERRKDRKQFVYKLNILGGKHERARFIKLIKPRIKNSVY